MKTQDSEQNDTAYPFPFAIVNQSGKYYMGTVRSPWESNFSENRKDAYHYAIFGAERKLRLFPEEFKGCSIIRIFD